jgi:hypothetical protein
MFSATPHYVFARTTQEQRQDYLAAQQARQVIAGMSFKQRLAATRSPRYEFPDKPTSPSPQQRKLMKLAMRKLIAEAEAEENPDQ